MKKEPEDTETSAAKVNLDPLPEPQEHNKDVISYRRPEPGETFLGGRGVILGSPLFSNRLSARRAKEEEEFKQQALKAFDGVLKKEVEAQLNAHHPIRSSSFDNFSHRFAGRRFDQDRQDPA